MIKLGTAVAVVRSKFNSSGSFKLKFAEDSTSSATNCCDSSSGTLTPSPWALNKMQACALFESNGVALKSLAIKMLSLISTGAVILIFSSLRRRIARTKYSSAEVDRSTSTDSCHGAPWSHVIGNTADVFVSERITQRPVEHIKGTSSRWRDDEIVNRVGNEFV